MSQKNALYTAAIALGVAILYSKYGAKAGLGVRHGS